LETNLLNDTRSGDEGKLCCTAGNALIIANNWQVMATGTGMKI